MQGNQENPNCFSIQRTHSFFWLYITMSHAGGGEVEGPKKYLFYSSMHACMHIHVCIHVHAWMYAGRQACMHEGKHACLTVEASMHTCTYACLYIHADRHASMHAWLYSRAAKESALVIFFFGPKMDPKLQNSLYKLINVNERSFLSYNWTWKNVYHL